LHRSAAEYIGWYRLAFRREPARACGQAASGPSRYIRASLRGDATLSEFGCPAPVFRFAAMFFEHRQRHRAPVGTPYHHLPNGDAGVERLVDAGFQSLVGRRTRT
jgi:hypothetical protein